MFDVIHALYEDDITPLWEQHIDVKDRIREAVYSILYGRPYEFSTTKGAGKQFEEPPDFDGPTASTESVDRKREIKPYIRPSTEEELMRVLGPPMR